jgi:hypothetical protein
MLKLHPGFKAIAILAGPAALIVCHQALSESFSSRRPYDPAAIRVMQQIYQRCTERPRLERTVRCNEYATYIEGCMHSAHSCTLRSSYELLTNLDFDPPPLRSQIQTVAVTE